jgi:hypothetical protein
MVLIWLLLIFLVGSILLGLVRVFNGQSFLPEPEPGEDRVFQDRKGRWWREEAGGTIEDAFRKSSSEPSRMVQIGEFVAHSLAWQLRLIVVLIVAFICLSAPIYLASALGAPNWLIWIVGIGFYLLALRFGRKRGWY